MKQINLFILWFLSSIAYGQEASKNAVWQLNEHVWSSTHPKLNPGDKPLLDFDAIDNWRSLGQQLTISPDGRYIAYDIKEGHDETNTKLPVEIIVQSTYNTWKQVLPVTVRGSIGFFSNDSKQYIFEDKEGLCFLELSSNRRSYVKNLVSYKMPATNRTGISNNANEWLAMCFKNKDLILRNLLTGIEVRVNNVNDYNFDNSGKWLTCKVSESSPELLVYDLQKKQENRFSFPQSYTFSGDATRLLMNGENGLEYVNLQNGSRSMIWSAKTHSGNLDGFSFDRTGTQVVFNVKDALSASPDYNNQEVILPSYSIWYWKEGMGEARKLIDKSSKGIDAGWHIIGGTSFSENGQYIRFQLEKPLVIPQASKDVVPMDLWSYKDSLLQSAQASAPGKTTTVVTAIADVNNGKVIFVGKEDEFILVEGDFVKIKKKVSSTDRFWEKDYKRYSLSLVSLKNGKRYELPDQNSPQDNFMYFSPSGRYEVYFDLTQKGHYFSLDLVSGKLVKISRGIPDWQLGACFWESPDVWKQPVKPAGVLCWLKDDKGFLVYDDYDIWLLDPSGKNLPQNVTNGYGRAHNIVFEDIKFDRKWAFVTSQTVTNSNYLLKAFNIKTKLNGFFRKTVGKAGDPDLLYMGPSFIQPTGGESVHADPGMEALKAAGADLWIVKKQTPDEGANYCLTNDFISFKPITNLQQHKNVNWYTRELHHFKCLDGTIGEGILYKPENFDPNKKYPVIIPFYGRFADYLYVYQDPVYLREAIAFATNPGWLASHGYLVFVPSIKTSPLKHGITGFSVIEGAARYLQQIPFVDGKHIGACSHSWSSKIGSYALTHSKLLAAMVISEGYLHGNLINSAFTAYKDGESKLNVVENDFEFGNLWQHKSLWLDQTTILNLDKVKMPVLLYSAKAGGWDREYEKQTFQIFTGLRRLDKKAWWFHYDKGGHSLWDLNEMKDFTLRVTQYFDHYLKEAPAPRWMTQGLPNNLRKVESREELDPAGSCSLKNDCLFCKAWNTQNKRTPLMFKKPCSEWRLDDDLQKQNDKK